MRMKHCVSTSVTRQYLQHIVLICYHKYGLFFGLTQLLASNLTCVVAFPVMPGARKRYPDSCRIPK